MEYKTFYKNTSRNCGGARKDETLNYFRSKRESARHDMFSANRNFGTPEIPVDTHHNKENTIKKKTLADKKRQSLARRLKIFKEEKAKKKAEDLANRKRAFLPVVAKNAFMETVEPARKPLGAKNKPSVSAPTIKTNSALKPTPKIGNRKTPTVTRSASASVKPQVTKHYCAPNTPVIPPKLIIKTPKHLANIKSKVDSKRKDNIQVPRIIIEKQPLAKKRILKDDAKPSTSQKAISEKETKSDVFLKPSKLIVPAKNSKKPTKLDFCKDGSFITSTNRKSTKISNLKEKINISSIKVPADDLFDGISPIETNTPAKEPVKINPNTRQSRRQTIVFVESPMVEKPSEVATTNDFYPLIKPKTRETRRQTFIFVESPMVETPSEMITTNNFNPLVKPIARKQTIVFEESPVENPSEEPTKTDLNSSYTIILDSDDENDAKNKRRSCGNKRSSIIFIEMNKNVPEINDKHPSVNKRMSLAFRESDIIPENADANYYYQKIEDEIKRLNGLCELYPLEEDNVAISENIKGLIMAAHGQTEILIKKKLSKLRNLVDHFSKNEDQRVTKNDLEGFWEMVSIDLDNLNDRFEKLRLIKENGWKEMVEEAPKVKKIRGGGGIKKRGRPATKASGIADMIRKAREEKKKQLQAELDNSQLVVKTRKSLRIAETPMQNPKHRSSLCAGCTPRSANHNHSVRGPKSILKTPGEKKSRKKVVFIANAEEEDESLKTPVKNSIKPVRTPKPKARFAGDEENEYKYNETPTVAQEILKRKRRSSTKFMQDVGTPPSKRRSRRFTIDDIEYVDSPK